MAEVNFEDVEEKQSPATGWLSLYGGQGKVAWRLRRWEADNLGTFGGEGAQRM
jgi:hypothetical protein